MEKTFTVYQRNACKSIIDDRGRAGFGENDLCKKKIKPFAEHDLRVMLQRAGNDHQMYPSSEFLGLTMVVTQKTSVCTKKTTDPFNDVDKN